jgi:hypothetical protein
MAKLITFVVLAMLWSGVAAAGDATPGRTVNLNQPGALVALQPARERPSKEKPIVRS